MLFDKNMIKERKRKNEKERTVFDKIKKTFRMIREQIRLVALLRHMSNNFSQ